MTEAPDIMQIMNAVYEDEKVIIPKGLLQECHLDDISTFLRKNGMINHAYMIDEISKISRDPESQFNTTDFY
jgi:hypothetical protein